MILRHRKLIWQIFPSYLLIIVAALIAVALYISSALEAFYLHETQRHLEAHVKLFRGMVQESFSPEQQPQVHALCRTFGNALGSRMTVILPSGQIIGDSMEEPSQMDNHGDRAEILAAFADRIGVSTRYSYTIKRQMMYVAFPVKNGARIVGVVRASLPVLTIRQALHLFDRQIVLGGLVVAIFAAIISFGVAYWLNQPLDEIRKGAEEFARGHLQYRIYPAGSSQEFRVLADALNQMATQLNDRIDQITRQRNELETMLASMVEAVVVVDSEERIVRCNQAAGKLFKIDVNAAKHRSIQEVIRNVEIQRFLQTTLHSQQPVEDLIEIDFEGEQFLRAYGTLLKNGNEQTQGALLVFHNITRLEQLENMRREFVANVSHELKTPITAIKGFVETLQTGALKDLTTAPRFLEIIARNANRLETIIDDLLALSRIEQGEDTGQIALTPENITAVLRTAITACALKASEKEITITLDAPETLFADVNADLLEQAVANLLDNALKYSGQRSAIQVQGLQRDQQIIITVKDRGCGIPAEHLPRLFERFYRVDKARSRNLGGTGLGLAIVKHIIQAHQGTVTVESAVGEGSVFTISVPALALTKV